ncbi:DUF305 domain-containing protein [Saccharomonospora piscinae]|uniref:DUF305 domain-containing protein n=1 Tax=Saccharomonospora piscinae TaxID=687388 RepID=A0A1V9A5A2_SACPI|nr:DUF305 domain-containing protein [Saccharomonospora piscinae]OQO92307.1 DUF305 domain-containing protein [Saccharomonospora piscinae]TLW91984.1 DUF305 domain-containing protein [Saccharomonospora piscinae]
MAAREDTRENDGTERGTPTWSRAVIFGAAALAVLLLGATVGLLIGQHRGEEPRSAPTFNAVDVGFAQDMSRHHLQAVTMANWARDHSEDPAIRQLAFDISSVQLEQVGRMKGWLMLWGKPEDQLGEPMEWMSGPEGHGHSGSGTPQSSADDVAMPGMATDEELARMRSLSGEELDVYFLQLMLRHHQGGTDMAQYGHDHASVSAVRTLANSMLVSQGAEMDLMRNMLAERGGQPLPFP